jgi:hypothetical protein
LATLKTSRALNSRIVLIILKTSPGDLNICVICRRGVQYVGIL